MKKVFIATWALRDRKIVVIEWVYTESTFFMKPPVAEFLFAYFNAEGVKWNFSRRIFSVLLRRANAIKVWANAIKMPDQNKYE